MKIQIVRKQPIVLVTPNKTTTLVFKKSHLHTQYKKIPIVSMYDEEGNYIPSSLKLTHINTRVPSTLLSRWVNNNLADKLLNLKDRCHTVEKVNLDKGTKSKWWFTCKEDGVFGLHKIKLKENGTTFRTVMIDDSLGMQAVKNILKLLDIEVECIYDENTQKVTSIILKGDL